MSKAKKMIEISMAEIEIRVFANLCKESTIRELAELQQQAKAKLDEAKKAQSVAQEIFDELRLKLIPDKMDEMGCSSIKLDGIGRLTISGDMYAGIQSGHKEGAYNWMEEEGFGDLIKSTLNSSTLKAWAKEQISKGKELPEEFFKITPFERASITKT